MSLRRLLTFSSLFLLAAEHAGAEPALWEQANINGFGVPGTPEVTALEAFGGYLYAGTHNPVDPEPLLDGAQIFRSPDGMNWTAVAQPGFGSSHDNAPPAVLDFTVFNGRIYAGTGRGNASQVWRSLDGTTWAPMNVTGFSDPDNVNVSVFAVYQGMIHAGVTNEVSGAQIWRSYSGDNNSWTRVAPAVLLGNPATVTGFAEFPLDGGLYAAVAHEADAPVQIWRTYGGDWETVIDDGFGDPATLSAGGMAVFGGDLYVGAGSENVGAQLWRSPDGNTWEQVIPPGFGDANNLDVAMVAVFHDQLHAGVRNQATGMEIWRTADGAVWEQINADGFGSADNTATNCANAVVAFDGGIYVGAANIPDGGTLWRTSVVTGVGGTTPAPAGFRLGAAVPNPSSRFRIPFAMSRDAEIRLDVHDTTGRLVRVLAHETRAAGAHQIHWDGRDDGGLQVAEGVYFYRLQAGSFRAAGRLVLRR